MSEQDNIPDNEVDNSDSIELSQDEDPVEDSTSNDSSNDSDGSSSSSESDSDDGSYSSDSDDDSCSTSLEGSSDEEEPNSHLEELSNLENSSIGKRSYMNHRGRGIKNLKRTLKEEIFLEADLAGEDPALLDHRSDRRALAKRLEGDPVFRAEYIKKQEEERKRRLEAEEATSDEESMNTEDCIKMINKEQAYLKGDINTEELDDDEFSVTEDITEDPRSTSDSTYTPSGSSYTQESVMSDISSTFENMKSSASRHGIYIANINIQNVTINM